MSPTARLFAERVRTIALGGVGLMGGSLGLRLRALPSPPRITAFGRTAKTLERAQERGAIDSWSTDPREAVRDADLVVLCSPVRAIPELFSTLGPALKDGAIVTDVGSTKSWIVSEAEKRLPARVRFVGSHPMTGSERDGIEFASAGLYEQAMTVVVPTALTDDAALFLVKALWETVGSLTLTLSAEMHDRIVASVSHLPHVLAALLVNTVAERSKQEVRTWSIAAGGFRDTTRIAGSSPEIWRDICLTNRAAILEALKETRSDLDGFITALTNEDEDGIATFFADARRTRQQIPAKGAGLLPVVNDLYVEVPNRPAVLSEVTGILGEAGVNIIDIEIAHVRVSGGDAPLRLFFDTEDERGRAQELLVAKGYTARKAL